MNTNIQIQGLDRQQMTELLESCGFRVEHRSCHRGYWTNSKIFNQADDKIGNISPSRAQSPLTASLVMQMLTFEELVKVYRAVVSERSLSSG